MGREAKNKHLENQVKWVKRMNGERKEGKTKHLLLPPHTALAAHAAARPLHLPGVQHLHLPGVQHAQHRLQGTMHWVLQ